MFYRHSTTLTAVYCVAYMLVFTVGLVGNSFVIAVVLRSPRMRTVTNFFIVNLAVADILVIVFCLPATLMGNIFVRKYYTYLSRLYTYIFYLAKLPIYIIYKKFRHSTPFDYQQNIQPLNLLYYILYRLYMRVHRLRFC